MKPTRQSSRGRTPGGHPNPIDVHVGSRLRLRRTLLGLSQEALGEALGLTFQQIQKYERGANRIGASRLFDLARALEVPVEYFYDDMPPDVMAASPRHMACATEEPSPQRTDPMSKRETLDLVRTYYKIGDPNVRKRVYELARALAAHTGGKTPD
jgi:transcriptional regulator with XRE-family HTH domain